MVDWGSVWPAAGAGAARRFGTGGGLMADTGPVLPPEAEGRLWPSVEVAAHSDRGRVRERNEDSFAYYVPGDALRRAEHGSLFVIADGVGGGPAGHAASAEAANVLLQEYYFSRGNSRPRARLHRASLAVGSHLFSLASSMPSFRRMQTTLTALLIRGAGWWACHVGDSKLLLLRRGRATQLTRDHSLAAEMVSWNILKPREASGHPGRHMLTRSVGIDPVIRPDLAEGQWRDGDVFVLATDGVFDHVTGAEMVAWFDTAPLAEAVARAVDAANARGGEDNLTVMAVRVGS
jgi:serine/threonine protein phosphatase PrpC